jgi:CheY-like chemotaxis protein
MPFTGSLHLFSAGSFRISTAAKRVTALVPDAIMLLDVNIVELSSGKQGGGTKIRTVIADDNAALMDALLAIAELDGQVDVVGRARDGAEAVQVVAQYRPQLVLLDVHMPRMDGLEAAALLARYFPHTRVVLMSGDETPEMREKCFAAGAAGFLAKGGFPEELTALLRNLFPAEDAAFRA